MGKSLSSTATKLQELAKAVSSSPERLQRLRPKHSKPPPFLRIRSETRRPTSAVRVDLEPVKRSNMEDNWEGQKRVPLAQVVSDCVKRWFQDTLKEAKKGDSSMQVLVGQMYFSGYGVPRDAQKGRAWINRASKSRSSAWKVSDKPPGYNASDSDSDELKGDTN
ncbi:hypothetical protein Pint_06612 [Pistacia integerrima]|uniref:Uncharacterized protein n=1 Tax=Pistacia integerrima TaxID=434235 RepID=A0ACC0Z3Q8_9ROSI|nr:hypothetical protein Pint_06612 [Pistacia integerrima]